MEPNPDELLARMAQEAQFGFRGGFEVTSSDTPGMGDVEQLMGAAGFAHPAETFPIVRIGNKSTALVPIYQHGGEG
jgi:hypothetical protein